MKDGAMARASGDMAPVKPKKLRKSTSAARLERARGVIALILHDAFDSETITVWDRYDGNSIEHFVLGPILPKPRKPRRRAAKS
jgi:hypothetical protein